MGSEKQKKAAYKKRENAGKRKHPYQTYACVCDRRCFTTVNKRTTTGVQQRQKKKKKKKDNKQNWQYQTYKKYVHQPRESERDKEREKLLYCLKENR
jgi:hypothetical protein